jgi:TonB family protein
MSKPESWKSWEGRVVDGKFPLREYLGGSDHSAVFLTEISGPGPQRAAIKLIEAKGMDVDGELLRLRATAILTHPHLVHTIETGRCQFDGGSVLYIAMEHADDDLAQILPQRALEPSEVEDLLPPVIDALSYLHGRGFVHGRIKPSNVLAVGHQLKLSADNALFARNTDSTRRRRDAYDAPETAAGIVTPEGDIWSVGAILVAALTQNVALAEDGSGSKSGLPQNIPEPFRGIARECLHLDPKRRCSLAEIQARLQPPGRSVPAEPEVVAVPSQPSQPERRRPILAVLMALIAVLAIVAAVMYWRGKRPEVPAASAPAETPGESTSAAPPPLSPGSATAQPEPPEKVTTAGEVAHRVLPHVPQSALDTIAGTVKVRVRVEVNASGKVTSARFQSPGTSRYFARQAMNAAESWKFKPPMVDGQPTASAWLLDFHFRRTLILASAQRLSH